MRLQLASILAVQLLAVVTAVARPTGPNGNDDGVGRLGKVTGGIDSAASSGANRGGTGGGVSQDASSYEGELYRKHYERGHLVVVDREGTVVRRTRLRPEPSGGPARIDLFVGIQKVIESDRSYAASLSVEDKWFRISGSISEYREQQMNGTRTALTVPTLLLGARVMSGATRAHLEAGVVFARTQENGMTGSSLTGPIVGIHLEHAFAGPTLVGDAHAMAFEAGVKAYSGRVGLRAGHFEVAVRVLDFNVGPALYGPEVGLQF
ncbi:MAG: hypothetical protein H0T42_00110 [Deltaproteobacteria bacterium]|nr:hypothetical protein [Deltaproteobacteria bacterium]